jgi:hypothetical protein
MQEAAHSGAQWCTVVQSGGNEEKNDSTMAAVWRDCACIVKQRTLDTTNHLFQLASVLTPSGRGKAREEAIHACFDVKSDHPIHNDSAKQAIEKDRLHPAEYHGLWSSKDEDNE